MTTRARGEARVLRQDGASMAAAMLLVERVPALAEFLVIDADAYTVTLYKEPRPGAYLGGGYGLLVESYLNLFNGRQPIDLSRMHGVWHEGTFEVFISMLRAYFYANQPDKNPEHKGEN